MSDYYLDPRQNIEAHLSKIFQDIAAKSSARRIKEKMGKDIDKEIGRIFKLVAVLLENQRSNTASTPKDLAPHIAVPWETWNNYKGVKRYRKRKSAKLGHSKWFVYSGELQSRLSSVSSKSILSVVGNTEVTTNLKNNIINVKMFPAKTFPQPLFEKYFGDILGQKNLTKLLNKKLRYRSLIGPAFASFLQDILPEIMRRSLRSL